MCSGRKDLLLVNMKANLLALISNNELHVRSDI